MSSEEDEDDENYAAPDGGEEEYVELDLNKTLTWTGNAVNVQAGGEFRLPLIVPRPSVLAIQFEVEGGYDIEFSLNFKDDHDQSSGVLVEPVRVSDREGQLDIDTTGVCELLWSNSHAWMYSKVLSYQLQLAPKVNTQMRKYRRAVLQAACDFRVVAAAESAEEVDRNLRTLKTRTGKLQDDEKAMQEKAKAAENRRTRYLSHVKKLESEVEAAKAHVAQAEADVAACEREAAEVESRLVAMQGVRSLDAGVTEDMQLTLDDCEEPLTLLFDAYAGSMYAADDDDDEGAAEKKIDRAELIHLLQVCNHICNHTCNHICNHICTAPSSSICCRTSGSCAARARPRPCAASSSGWGRRSRSPTSSAASRAPLSPS